MSSTVLYMSMSLDGFITGPNASLDNPLGDGGERLHEWFFPLTTAQHHQAAAQQLTGGSVNRQIYDEIISTGAVIAGRGTFEGANGWGGDHHDGVPIYIPSRNPAPAAAANWPAVHYVNDIDAAFRAAKQAAGDKNVLVHGAGVIARHALTTGLLDELEISLVPVLLGEGQRLFEHLGTEHHELERTRVLEGDGGVTHLHYRVRRG